ncbi:hypothetical protein G9A89_005613 [Geosiphon pyriformis]|nr:hypothetical protein G9A89_005613 [Geosiphon pyriformis]
MGTLVNGFSSDLTGLGICLNAKKKCINSIYFCDGFYKKSKKPVSDGVIDLSAGLLSLKNIGGAAVKPVVFWSSNVNSIASNISGILNIKNIKNTVMEKTSYANLDTLISQSSKVLLFDNISDNNNVLVLLFFNFVKSNQPVKLFALDVKLFAVFSKTNSNKLLCVKKNFYQVNGFERVSISSKFPEIIRSFFTSELNLKKTKKLAVLVEFETSNIANLIASKWSVLMGKNSVYVVLAVDNKHFTTAHDLFNLLESYSEKTCFIGCNPGSYVYDRCAVVCFKNKASKLAAIGFTSVFKSVNLCWAGLFLVYCA